MESIVSTWRPFRCDVQQWHGAVWIQPGGEIDYGTAGFVQAAVAEGLDSGCEQLVVDLRGVTFIDSSGLRTLIEARKAALGRRMDFSVAPGPSSVRRLFEITGTSVLFPAPDENGPAAP